MGNESVENTRVGPFQVLEKLGTTKRHRVYHAIQVDQQRDVALKFIKIPPNVGKSRALNRIRRETKILKKLIHPNLVSTYGAGVENDNIFFAQELIEGETLSVVLTRRGKLAWDLAVEYAKQIARALEYIHGHEIIHLKLSPDKILITPEGHVKVADLRLNRSRKRRWDATSRKALEIVAYMPPEQFAGAVGTAKSDFYALGVILYEMLTGKLPYAPDTISQMIRMKQTEEPPPISDYNLECPIWLEKIVYQLMQIDPLRRPHSARTIVLALEEVQEIDSAGTGVAEKITSSFSPLNAGMDKTEAREVLGYSKASGNSTWLKWVQIAVPGLVLMVIAGFVGFKLQPDSPQKKYYNASILVQSSNPDHWTLAKTEYIDSLMVAGEESPYYAMGLELLATIDLNRLRHRVETHEWTRANDSRYQKLFLRACQYEDEQDYDRAVAVFHQVIDGLPPVGEEKYIRDLAAERLVGAMAKRDESLDQKFTEAVGEDIELTPVKVPVDSEEPVVDKTQDVDDSSQDEIEDKTGRKEIPRHNREEN